MSRHRCILVTKRPDGRFDVPGRPDPCDRHSLPAGAMWEDEGSPTKGPDGKAWNIKTPDGHVWHIDRPTADGSPWRRWDEVPNLTVRPSIHITTTRFAYGDPTDPNKATGQETVTCYHGYLSSGWLESTPDSPC